MGDIIRNKILAKVRQAKYFSIIADEATDEANDEQLSICIRYVEEQEKFIAFHECVSGVTGVAKYHLKPCCLAAIATLTSWTGL